MVLFNNDAFAEPQWLAELSARQSRPKIFAVQSLMIRHFDRELADDAGDYVTWMGLCLQDGDGRRVSRYTKQKRIFSACGGAALYRKRILDEIGAFDENFFAYFEDVDLSWRANNAGYKNVLCPTAKCYHICGASTGACVQRLQEPAERPQQHPAPLKNEPLLMLVFNFLPLAWATCSSATSSTSRALARPGTRACRKAFDLLKAGSWASARSAGVTCPIYLLMELWMIWNMVPYLWYRLVIVRFDLK